MKFVFGIAVIFWAAGIVFSRKGRRKTKELYGWLGLATIWSAFVYVFLLAAELVMCYFIERSHYELFHLSDATMTAAWIMCGVLIIEVVALYAVGGKKEKEEENDAAH